MTFSVTLNSKESGERLSITPISKDELFIRICDPNICASITINKLELEKAIQDIMSVYCTYG